MFNHLRRFPRARAGNAVLIFALVMPVLLMAIGGAIDFGRAVQLRVAMQDAADVASLGAVAINSAAYKVALQMGDGEITAGTQQAHDIYVSDMISAPELSTPIITTQVSKSGTVLTSNVSVSANYKPYLLQLFGFATLPLSVTSKSSSTIPPYIDFYLLLDNSPSMGLGATTADINKLVSATSKMSSDANCAFACHLSGSTTDYYSLARKVGVTMRIDVVREATQNLMTTAKNTQTLNGQYRMAIYDFGVAADKISQTAPPAYQVSALTSNLTQSASDAGTIDLMTIPAQNYNSDRQSNFSSVLASMNTAIPTPGNGTSATNPQKVLFMVSDGLNDGYDCAYGSCRRITPLDISQCTAMKARGVRIAVLYTTYLLLDKGQNSFFDGNVRKYVTPTDQIATNMQACASPGLYFAVGPDEGISEAMTALFNKVVQVVRINS
ncbi:MAG TPA: TadE/TadG family type IV pilus assembly protein [Asticcacaulis sp.]